jgi:hypothetical protein
MTMFQNLRRVMGEASTLKLECEACGHEARWTRSQAFARLDPDASPYEIRTRLRCESCGARGQTQVRI